MDQSSHQPRAWLVSQLFPAVLGVGVAAALGGAGFGLGCVYGQVVASAPVAVRVAQVPAGAAVVHAPRAAARGAMGGPEEVAPLTATQVSFPVLQPRQALATTMALIRPVVGGWVSSHYGQRLDPFTGLPAVHRGLDFAGLDNCAILAAGPGVVTWSGRQRGYGNLIEIDHGNGWVTRYGHNSFNLVTPGDYVKPGQTIALMGSTGRATGTHLHFEVLYRGRHQNPTRFVPRDA